MRAARSSTLLVALLFFSSMGSTLAMEDGTAVADRAVPGEGAGRATTPENVERFENAGAEAQGESEPRVPQEQQHGSKKMSSEEQASSAAHAAAAASAASVEDAACSAADGSTCTANEQQQHQQQHSTGKSEVTVETGEQDRIRIEHVGRAEGTLPETDRPSSSTSSALPHGTAAQKTKATAAAAAAATAAAAVDLEFELLRCDGESYDHRDGGGDGGLTAKGVWNHLRSKLEASWGENAQRVG